VAVPDAAAGAVPVVTAFRRRAAEHPDRTALVVGRTSLTYRELDRASTALAHHLHKRGARAGRVVCVRLEQSALAVVTMLACLRVGAAWAVVEPAQPAHRLRSLLRDTDCAVVVHPGRDETLEQIADLPEVLEVAGPDLYTLANSPAPGGGEDWQPVPEGVPACLVHVPGADGEPLAVMVGRDRLAVAAHVRETVYGARESVLLAGTRLSSDGSLGGVFWSLTRGHTLVLPHERQLRQVPELARLAAQHRATHLVADCSAHRALLAHGDRLPDSLRLVAVTGGECTRELVRAHQERLPEAELAAEYGPAEVTASCAVARRLDPAVARVPLGRPWPGVTVRVLDERLRRVPPGQQGELYLGGPYAATGYAGRPARTAERFLPDPYGAPGARMFRTGDLASFDDAGELHHHGRTDHRISIRGVRTEPGEIESVLERHPDIGRAVVLCLPSGGDGPRLVAFLTPAVPHGHVPAAQELRGHCADFLVEAAVPGLFLRIESMPLDSSGRPDRAALRDQVPDGRGGTGAAPEDDGDWSGLRGRVRAVWAEVLGHDDIRPDDNFFAVGGSSLKVIDLHTQLDQEWPGVVRMGELFDLITVSAQSDVLAARLGGGDRHEDEERHDDQDLQRDYEL
jgi:amino acid adenylation domain-containing protein